MMNKRDKKCYQKILKHCEQACQTHHFFHEDKTLFYDEEKGHTYLGAVAMDILQIVELAKSLTPEALQLCPDIPWKNIIRIRDFIAHHYGALERDTVWDTLVNHVPALAKRVQQILEEDAQD